MNEEVQMRNLSEHHPRKSGGMPEFNFINVLVVILVLAVLVMGLYIFKPALFKWPSGKVSSIVKPGVSTVGIKQLTEIYLVIGQKYR
jgi:hypothetical protein